MNVTRHGIAYKRTLLVAIPTAETGFPMTAWMAQRHSAAVLDMISCALAALDSRLPSKRTKRALRHRATVVLLSLLYVFVNKFAFGRKHRMRRDYIDLAARGCIGRKVLNLAVHFTLDT
jgi:hypothetical protein